MSELENLIKWAKTACEEERARIGFDCEEETLCPSWLPELERALLDYEAAQ